MIKHKYIFLLFIFCASYAIQAQSSSPKVVSGEIDLTEHEGLISLNGDWEFYYGTILDPETIQSPLFRDIPSYIHVPASWYKNNKSFPAQGCGTYRLTIKERVVPGEHIFSLRLYSIFSCYNLWINNSLVKQVGTVGETKETSSPAFEKIEYPIIINNNSQKDSICNIHIVIQVANFHHVRAGIQGEITFGEQSVITQDSNKKIALNFFIVGVILIIGLSHIMFFVVRPLNNSNLYFGILCIVMILRTVVVNDRIITQWIPNIDWETLFALDNFSGFGTLPFFGLYLYSLYKGEFPRRNIYIITIIGVIFSLIIFFTNVSFYGNLRIAFELYVFISCLYFLFGVLLRAIIKKRKDSLLNGLGFLVLIGTAVNDILHSMGIIDTGYIASFGLVTFMVFQTFTISKGFAQTVKNKIQLTEILRIEKQNLELANVELLEKNDLLEQQSTRIEEQREELYSQTEELRALNDQITSQNETLSSLNNDLNKEKHTTEQKNKSLNAMNEALVAKDRILSKVNKEMTDSLHYASFIQNALFPSNDTLQKQLEEYFVYWKPCRIVSGDFYWCKEIDENKTCIAIADCTGHGVPGAMMSVLGISFLNEIVENNINENSATYLALLREKVIGVLNSSDEQLSLSDGMDMAFIIYNKQLCTIDYAGAFRPLYIVRDEELIILPPTRNPIGRYYKYIEFTSQHFQLQKNDMIYAFTDGYADQMGGEPIGKFKIKRFKSLLTSIANLPMENQRAILRQTILSWIADSISLEREEKEQTDDILIFGMRV